MFVVAEAERAIFAEHCGTAMNHAVLDHTAVAKPQPERFEGIERTERQPHCGRNESRRRVSRSQCLQRAYIDVCSNVERWVLVLAKELVVGAARPTIQIHTLFHRVRRTGWSRLGKVIAGTMEVCP